MRIRTIKPEFWQNEGLAKLDDFTLLLAIGLLNYADDEGYFNANPMLIHGALFPLREWSGRIPGALVNLSNQGFLAFHSSENGRTFGHIVHFLRHQRINKASASKIKPLCNDVVRLPEDSGSNAGDLPGGTGIRDQGTGIREGEQGKGPIPRNRAGYHLPADETELIRERMVAINALRGRRDTTPWPKKEFEAFKGAGLHDLPAGVWSEQLQDVSEYYLATAGRIAEYEKAPGKDFRRRAMLTLLNNWAGEVDRARRFCAWLKEKTDREDSGRV